MRTEARLLPPLLQNRMSILLEGVNLPAEYPLTVLARLREIYEENVTSISQLLPRVPGGHGDILECYTLSPTDECKGSVLTVGIEGDRCHVRLSSSRQTMMNRACPPPMSLPCQRKRQMPTGDRVGHDCGGWRLAIRALCCRCRI
jgi:hypothetical protein